MGSAKCTCSRHATQEYITILESEFVDETSQVVICTATTHYHEANDDADVDDNGPDE